MLVDSELEIVPKELWSHPAVVSNARKRGKKPSQVLLDSNLHHTALGSRDEAMRRGRPDIVHQFLLLGLDSLLNLEDGLRLYVHTRNDELIDVDPKTRLPKNLNRYMGLFEELFASRAVPSKEAPLLSLRPGMDLMKCIAAVREEARSAGRELTVVLLSPEGETKSAYDLFKDLTGANKGRREVLCLIGGFSHGDFRSDVKGPSDLTVSLSDILLKVWSVEMELIVAYRFAEGNGDDS
jgi:rRNA small subunit pseudouridine methyltransferase Nep1